MNIQFLYHWTVQAALDTWSLQCEMTYHSKNIFKKIGYNLWLNFWSLWRNSKGRHLYIRCRTAKAGVKKKFLWSQIRRIDWNGMLYQQTWVEDIKLAFKFLLWNLTNITQIIHPLCMAQTKAMYTSYLSAICLHYGSWRPLLTTGPGCSKPD